MKMSPRAMIALIENITRQPGLITRHYWKRTLGMGCAIGSLVPDFRKHDQVKSINVMCTLNKVGLRNGQWSNIVVKNDRFQGSPRERKEYMLRWLHRILGKKLEALEARGNPCPSISRWTPPAKGKYSTPREVNVGLKPCIQAVPPPGSSFPGVAVATVL